MVMHRAIVTWFILLVFFILLCLQLETRIHWNWFLIFLPLWVYDVILLIDALFNIIIHCKDDMLWSIIKNKNNLLVMVILLKIAAQVMICLKLEYNKTLELELYQVLAPLWVLLPILIVDVTIKLFKVSNGDWTSRLC
ncbi:transmembrane protein 60 [Onthophagus taurus]|uniref:transmembrane protein 60 n=1 Tax=Onthophagus taurus TaxID=166361 RepID=UPI000C20B831|nr:transmembrane protein 60 [Onthophagus taurus]